jgi:hypothetical protein
MHLDYKLSENWEADAALLDEDETTLRYRAAPGDILLRGPEADFSTEWGWVPLVDFVLALRDIVAKLSRGERETNFEFTESEATLQFLRKGEEVHLTASYAPGEIVTPLSHFHDSVHRVAGRLKKELFAKYPELAKHKLIQNLE